MLSFIAGSVWAHGDSKGSGESAQPISAEEKAFGRAGDSGKVVRTINVDTRDEMKFLPNSLRVKRGDTVKFVVHNAGKVMHEMVLGTMEELKAHAEMMRKHPGMEHDEPYMAHVAPGNTETFIWQFTRAGEFYYGCLIPGHFEAGMMGRIEVTQ